jgi:hypothetical protein
VQDIVYSAFYSSAINRLTLAQALDRHYQLNPQFTKWHDYPSELQRQTMKSHDICHVIFGCDTQLVGEFRVELWTFFGVNLTLKEYTKLVSNSEINKEPFEIARRIGVFKVLRVMLLNFWRVPSIWVQSVRLKEKWPVLETDSLMDKSIGELRKKYGIRVK